MSKVPVTRDVNGVTLNFMVDTGMERKYVFHFYKEQEYTELMMAASRGLRFIDVGSAIGATALAVATVASEVLAFEPDPTHYDALVTNLAMNSLPVTAYPVALGERSGTARLYTPANINSTCPSIVRRPGLKGIDVPMATLDDYPPADVLKIDVEGYEAEVLAGMHYRPRWIFLEIHTTLGHFDEGSLSAYRNTWRRKRGTEWLTVWEKLPQEVEAAAL